MPPSYFEASEVLQDKGAVFGKAGDALAQEALGDNSNRVEWKIQGEGDALVDGRFSGFGVHLALIQLGPLPMETVSGTESSLGSGCSMICWMTGCASFVVSLGHSNMSSS
jgi:hypothetical protein